MGLGTVELVMELEDAFQISIPDEDAEKVQSIGDTVKCVAALLNKRGGRLPIDSCWSAHIFYKVRRELVAAFGIQINVIHPKNLMEDMIPPGPGRAAWQDIARRCGLPKPPLNILKPFSPRFPRKGTSLGELISCSDSTAFYRSDGSVNLDAVTSRIMHVVATSAGVAKKDLHLSTHYVRDLYPD